LKKGKKVLNPKGVGFEGKDKVDVDHTSDEETEGFTV
jgi:hypothetical protein